MKSIGVIGVGRLGLCTALVLEKAGYNVVCYDVNKATREAINQRFLKSPEKGVTSMLAEAKHIQAVDSLKDIIDLDIFFCVVPTPSLSNGFYDHQYVDAVVNEMIPLLLKPGLSRKLLNICCTTMPSYCDTVQQRFNENDIPMDVCYNPEFIAQGDILHGFTHPDLVLIGEASKEAGNILVSIYEKIVESNPSYCRMTRKEAEITKISINCFITTKISFANTIGDLCVASGCNQDIVLKAIGQDSRIGNKYFRWGFGYGGPCFPRDNRALCLYGRQQGLQNRIGEATDATNKDHRSFLVNYLIQHKGEKEFVISDLAYKPGTLILEQSQSLQIALDLIKEGHTVYIEESPELCEILRDQYPSVFMYGRPQDKDILWIDNRLTMFRT